MDGGWWNRTGHGSLVLCVSEQLTGELKNAGSAITLGVAEGKVVQQLARP